MRKRIAPVAKTALGELHDVALVNQCHGGLVVVDSVLNRFANQALGTLARNRLDTDARRCGKADFLDSQFGLKESNQLLDLFGLGRKFNTGINIFGILTEDDHVGLLRFTQGRRNALEILDRTQTDVKVEFLAKRDVQGADTAANRGGKRPLDRNDIILEDLKCFFRQPDIGAIHLGGLFAGINFHPLNLPLAAIGFGDGRVDDLDHHRRNVEPGAVAFNVGNDRLIGH